MATSTKLDTVASKLKKAVRIISFENFDTPSTPLFKNLNIHPLSDAIKIKHAKFMWKLFNDLLPSSISTNFHANPRTVISHQDSRLTSLERFVVFNGPKIWNEIPNSIKTKPSLDAFSKNLSKFYLSNLC